MIHGLFLVPLLVLAIGLVYFIRKWPKGGVHATFSQHAASTVQATRYYIALFLVCLPPIVVWFVVWLVPTLQLPIFSVVAMIVAAAAQIIATSVPERAPNIELHRAITAVSLVAIIITTAFLWLSTHSNMVAGCLLMMLLIVAYASTLRDRAKYPMLLQVGFYASFFAALGSFIF
ncbi:MAG: hypothetical protein WAQ25_01375 [Candidatus Saccharimonas sp.]